MAPVPQKAPPTSRRPASRSSSHAGDVEQAGRSPSYLHAQLSSARSGLPTRNSPSPNLLRKKNKPDSHYTAAEQSQVSAPPTPPPEPRHGDATQTPAFDQSSASSRGSSEVIRTSDERFSQTASDSQATASAVSPTVTSDLPWPPRFPAARAPVSSPSSTSLSRMDRPRTLHDLGSDYTRYFNPFATQNNSATDLAIPLPRYNTSTPLMQTHSNPKRLSDPFDDDKVYSFEPKGPAMAAPTAIAQETSMRTSKNAFVDAADPEKAFFPYLDDRLGAPGADRQGYTFPMYWDEKEADDDMHLPMADDDVKLRARWNDHFSRDNILSTLGMVFMVVGLLCLFIVLPVLTSTGHIEPSKSTPVINVTSWATVNENIYPLMANVRNTLIDPDTPQSAMTRTALDGSTMQLMFSDEFNAQNRTFYPEDDPFFYAFDGWYGATEDLEWYDPDAITTWDGVLEIQMDSFANHGLNYRSGMLNSWNQLCFKGGVFEVSVSLPGPGGIHALWPGVWTMGNLGRPGYLATTDGMWPYTYNECDVGITPNQSSPDGLSELPGQRLPSCSCSGADHPTPGTGRGAPEIDIIEVSGDWGGLGIAVGTQSFQVAPFDVWWYPNYEYMQTPDYSTSYVNTYTGGPFQQAVSTTTMLNNGWYDGEMYQKYAFEYTPGAGEEAGVAWYVGDEMTMRFDARALGPNGNIGQRLISEEPMSLIMNLGISNNWVDIDWAATVFPTIMRIDYVRWYQKEGAESVTCDPPGYETTEYIANHPEAYNNYNITHWTDIPGYTWPQNTLMNGCSA